MTRSTLAELVTEFGWKPAGPCGGSCDWPTCHAERSNCVKFSPFQQTLAGELRRRQGAEPKTWYLHTGYSGPMDEKPHECLTEVGVGGYEQRKVAYYGDGTVEWADVSEGSGRLALSCAPVPAFEELGARNDSWARETTAQHFEGQWGRGQGKSVQAFLAGVHDGESSRSVGRQS
ncbi:DUF6881 domain-containing protein [Streptomyces sp. NPDC005435]|uniref:DUF6881 domain-containing protein n=1 Tax=Streptomyces sp. NPDC005435 TaxID=3154464 RepID=UPI0034566784